MRVFRAISRLSRQAAAASLAEPDLRPRSAPATTTVAPARALPVGRAAVPGAVDRGSRPAGPSARAVAAVPTAPARPAAPATGGAQPPVPWTANLPARRAARPPVPAGVANLPAHRAARAPATAGARAVTGRREARPPLSHRVLGRVPARRPGRPHHPRYGLPGARVVIVALMILIVAGLAVEQVTGLRVLPSGWSVAGRAPGREHPALDASPPAAITIRSLGVEASVFPVGLAANGAIDVPPPDRYHEVGWYVESPTPGQHGPAVIVGHVDTHTGPAVFHDLKRLREGDQIEIARMDGSVAVFEVQRSERFDKSQLPVDQVYGDFSRPGLRLITCGGRWVGGPTGYADNLVVFATLVDGQPPTR